MTFKMNNRTWKIAKKPSEWMLEELKKESPESTYCFGMTKYAQQTIYINEEPCLEVQRQTLLHELVHCYLWSYAYNFSQISEEGMCDIYANSHYVIHDIVERYFDDRFIVAEEINIEPAIRLLENNNKIMLDS